VLCVEFICHICIVISAVSSLCARRRGAINGIMRRLQYHRPTNFQVVPLFSRIRIPLILIILLYSFLFQSFFLFVQEFCFLHSPPFFFPSTSLFLLTPLVVLPSFSITLFFLFSLVFFHFLYFFLFSFFFPLHHIFPLLPISNSL
jgi:hypothetical protein